MFDRLVIKDDLKECILVVEHKELGHCTVFNIDYYGAVTVEFYPTVQGFFNELECYAEEYDDQWEQFDGLENSHRFLLIET